MDIKTFYETIGGNYEEIMGRFMKEERVLKFVRRFADDGSFALLKRSLAEKNAEEAFRAAHTIKGVAQNLSFTALYEKAEPLTNILRNGSFEIGNLFCELEEIYERIIAAIAALE